MLASEHALELLFRQIGQSGVSPVSQLDGDGQSFCVPKVVIDVQQTGEELVQRVPGNPTTVEIEALRRECRPQQLP